jgi:hypothetical protein
MSSVNGGDAQPASIYRVDTQVVNVRISFGGGAFAQGDMFLRPSLVTDSGVESIADRMNDRDAFFPLRVRGEREETRLIGKAQVRFVEASDQPAPSDVVEAARAESTAFELAIEIDDGEVLTGAFYALLPRGKRRALDYVNGPHAGPFVPFFALDKLYVIHRAFIRHLRERGA